MPMSSSLAKMYKPDNKLSKTSVIRMDPDCAICHFPASRACDCEAKGLEVAIKQAEEQMMRSIYADIRSWVRAHAQDYILEYFRQLSEQRKRAHSSHLDRITAHAYYHYNAPPHPDQLSQAQNALKRGIDEDWQASVQRYPEVLQYFYGLVELTLPADDEPSVKEPPLGALTGHRKAQRRGSGGGGHGHAYGAITYPDAEQLPPRTPPPGRLERRTPAPSRERRQVPYRPATAHIDHAPFYPPY